MARDPQMTEPDSETVAEGVDARTVETELPDDLAAEGRAARRERARRRSQRRIAIAGGVFAAGIALVVIGWGVSAWHQSAAASARSAAATAAQTAAAAQAAKQAAASQLTTGEPPAPAIKRDPTPIFASYKSMLIRLPVPLKALTEVGFHQASYSYALPIKTSLPDADLGKAARHQGTGRKLSKQLHGPDAVLIGSVLRMWRNRPGKPDTAADVGAKAGTVILAPVSGTVIKLKHYKLYGKYDDMEIHIQPTGHPNLDVVMIHATNITCRVGDKVTAGITHLAHIRLLSNKFYDQLAAYSKGAGDHVHIEVNDATNPTYKGLVGAIDPKTWHRGDDSTGATATGESGSED